MERLLHQTGYVRWPKKIPGSGQGGTFVYAFWTADYTEKRPDETGLVELLTGSCDETVEADPFVTCSGPDNVIALPQPGLTFGPTCGEVYPPIPDALSHVTPSHPDTRMRERYLAWTRDCGAPLLAAICLGSSNASYLPDGQTAWTAGMKDLTRPGRKIVSALDALYGRRAHLVTYLDD